MANGRRQPAHRPADRGAVAGAAAVRSDGGLVGGLSGTPCSRCNCGLRRGGPYLTSRRHRSGRLAGDSGRITGCRRLPRGVRLLGTLHRLLLHRHLWLRITRLRITGRHSPPPGGYPGALRVASRRADSRPAEDSPASADSPADNRQPDSQAASVPDSRIPAGKPAFAGPVAGRVRAPEQRREQPPPAVWQVPRPQPPPFPWPPSSRAWQRAPFSSRLFAACFFLSVSSRANSGLSRSRFCLR